MVLHLNVQWLSSVEIYFVERECCSGTQLSDNFHLIVMFYTHRMLYRSFHCVCHLSSLMQRWFLTDNQVFYYYYHYRYYHIVQKGHCINDTNRRLRNLISWWNLFLHTITVGKRPWQYLTYVLAVHHMHKSIWCFYQNLFVSGFHLNGPKHIIECFTFLLRYPIMECQGCFFLYLSGFP